MWVPNTDPSGSGLILNARFKGQEGAADDAPMHSHLGVLGVTGFLMKDLTANPLDYVEGGALNRRRQELSRILDSTNPDLSAFQTRRQADRHDRHQRHARLARRATGLLPVGDRQDGRATVDRFARFFVMPQTGHGLSGTSYATDGDGTSVASTPIPNRYDQWGLLFNWVENNVAPGMSVVVTAGERSLPLCSYPTYPRYAGGAIDVATSFRCTP